MDSVTPVFGSLTGLFLNFSNDMMTLFANVMAQSLSAISVGVLAFVDLMIKVFLCTIKMFCISWINSGLDPSSIL